MGDGYPDNTLSDDFALLVAALREKLPAIDAPYLHGLLAACATVPQPDSEKFLAEISDQYPLPQSLADKVISSIGLLRKELSTDTFTARFELAEKDEAKRWIEGYLRAVEIHERQWKAGNELHPAAAPPLLMLHTIAREEFRRQLNTRVPGYEDLDEFPHLVTSLVMKIYRQFHNLVDDDEFLLDPDDDFDLYDDGPIRLMMYSEERLASMDENALFALVTRLEDRLPMEVMLECAGRKDAMVPLLFQHLRTDAYWDDDADAEKWWGLLHGIFILGLIRSDAAAQALLEGFRRITFARDHGLADWVAGYWPTLFRKTAEHTTDTLRQIAEDRNLDWYARTNAVDCVLADATQQGSAELEEALDWAAALCADATEDAGFRVMTTGSLLNQPRPRHRKIYTDMLSVQSTESWLENSFDGDDIERALAGDDAPEWLRFNNPWKFYEAEEIKLRQQRWRNEESEREQPALDGHEPIPATTYLREQAKTGRNSPCPCGSGNKYKKCCMNKS